MCRSVVLMSAAALVIISVASCGGQSRAPMSTSTPPPTPTEFLYHGCPVTLAQTVPFEPGRRSSLSDLPWIQAEPISSGITGHLFYAQGPQLVQPLYTNGQLPGGAATKILWMVENSHSGSELDISGTHLAPGQGSFQQTVPAATSPTTDYPSIVDVPAPGCWKLTLASGTVTGTVVFWVVAS
jgi:hypothetical protein